MGSHGRTAQLVLASLSGNMPFHVRIFMDLQSKIIYKFPLDTKQKFKQDEIT